MELTYFGAAPVYTKIDRRHDGARYGHALNKCKIHFPRSHRTNGTIGTSAAALWDSHLLFCMEQPMNNWLEPHLSQLCILDIDAFDLCVSKMYLADSKSNILLSWPYRNMDEAVCLYSIISQLRDWKVAGVLPASKPVQHRESGI